MFIIIITITINALKEEAKKILQEKVFQNFNLIELHNKEILYFLSFFGLKFEIKLIEIEMPSFFFLQFP